MKVTKSRYPIMFSLKVRGCVNKSLPRDNIQVDSKRWTQFRTSIFPELYKICE